MFLCRPMIWNARCRASCGALPRRPCAGCARGGAQPRTALHDDCNSARAAARDRADSTPTQRERILVSTAHRARGARACTDTSHQRASVVPHPTRSRRRASRSGRFLGSASAREIRKSGGRARQSQESDVSAVSRCAASRRAGRRCGTCPGSGAHREHRMGRHPRARDPAASIGRSATCALVLGPHCVEGEA